MQRKNKEDITLSIDHVQLVAKAVRQGKSQPLKNAFEKYMKLLCAENFDEDEVIKAQKDFKLKADHSSEFSAMLRKIFQEKYKEEIEKILDVAYINHIIAPNKVAPLRLLIITTAQERNSIIDDIPTAEEVWDLLNEEPLPPLATREEYRADYYKLSQAVAPDSLPLTAEETSLNPPPKKAAAFKKIYTALYEGQSSLFKINFLEEARQKKWSDEQLLKEAAGYTQKHPNSRVAQAFKLTEKFKNQNIDENNIKLFFKIYKWSFKNSHWFAISNLFSTPIYFFSSLKNKAQELKTREEKELSSEKRFKKIEKKIKTKSQEDGFDKTRTGKIHAALRKK